MECECPETDFKLKELLLSECPGHLKKYIIIVLDYLIPSCQFFFDYLTNKKKKKMPLCTVDP